MNKNKVPGLVTMAILTLITVIFWVFFNVYRVFTKKSPYVVPEEVLTPIDPNLDQNILAKLSQRKYLEESIIPDIPAEGGSVNPPISVEIPSPTATPTALPEIPSESPLPTPSPTGGAAQ